MCEECKGNHVTGYRCPCECHRIWSIKEVPSEKDGGNKHGK